MGFIDSIRREYLQVSNILRTIRKIGKVKADSAITAADIFEHWAREKPDNVAIYFENRQYTYRQYDQAANQFARWAQAQGIKRGEPVALLMENRPEYLFAWLGIVKIGAIAALINTNLRGQPLAHSLSVSGAKHVVLGAELAQSLSTALDYLPEKPRIWTTGGVVQGTHDLDIELSCLSPEPMDPAVREGMTASDKCFYIYTSGTTGMPKAANISHLRFYTMANAFAAVANARESDRMYNVLPLYHSAGGICAIGATLTVGGSVILRRKFSASTFWEDCHRYEATLFQYIGELCRYLLNAPVHPLERQHKIRRAIGNGLRPEIWTKFRDRFAIPEIVEFYGATEGNVSLVNLDGTPGAIGRIPRYLEGIFKVKIVRFDVENEKPIRGADGFCIEAKPDEPGEAIGFIPPDSPKALGRFEGYTNKADSEKKILRDVFEKDDAWFRTGDLLKKDKNGYFYFVDRIGDTFRWKGENVATSEVAQVLSSFPHVKEANVYGVHVPGADGRAGMASLVVEEAVDLNALHHHIERELPAYARPVFLRLQQEIEATGTFKHRKVDLVKEGFDPNTVTDPLFFDHPKLRGYVPLNVRTFQEIVGGELRL